MNIKQRLHSIFVDAFKANGIDNPEPMLQASQKFGDYQANGCMRAAKQMGQSPRELASQIVDWLKLSDHAGLFKQLEVAGPGFINIHLADAWLNQQLSHQLHTGNCGIQLTDAPQTIVIDYSSPNLAKEMHVGHLRGTVIGDVMVRILSELGHTVIRQNHMGDWGTQFGMLIAAMQLESVQNNMDMELADLEQFYRKAKSCFDDDKAFANHARDMVVLLQSGDKNCLKLWRQFIGISIDHSQQLYDKLGISLTKDDIMAESAYNLMLKPIVNELTEKGLIVEDKDAKVIFLEEFSNRDGEPAAAIVQKNDGGYLYLTTDLAALKYRINTLLAERLLYFIDARQSLHMQQLFTIGKKADWISEHHQLEHCPFGTVMGKDGKPFKTRSGEVVKLQDLVDESIERATQLVATKNQNLSKNQCAYIGKVVGIGAIKYAELSITRTSDYIFDWDIMLSFEGNTAPYLQYAFTRIRSLLAKANSVTEEGWHIQQPIEQALRLKLLQFPDVIAQIAINSFPHELCNYLFELAGLYMKFYEQCPVINSEEPIRSSRLKLCELTSKVIEKGLSLLGIEVLEMM